MRWMPFLVLGLVLVAGCGKGKSHAPADPQAVWTSSPSKVVEGIQHAYTARDEALYAALLAEDFRYYFRPQGADSSDILGWGKEEEVVATGNLFKTPDVEELSYTLRAGEPRPGAQGGWMMVPVSGGEMVVRVKNKEPMHVNLNRQEIVLRPAGAGKPQRWEVVEWYDFPSPEPPATDTASPEAQAPKKPTGS